jgi:hypothetical protein
MNTRIDSRVSLDDDDEKVVVRGPPLVIDALITNLEAYTTFDPRMSWERYRLRSYECLEFPTDYLDDIVDELNPLRRRTDMILESVPNDSPNLERHRGSVSDTIGSLSGALRELEKRHSGDDLEATLELVESVAQTPEDPSECYTTTRMLSRALTAVDPERFFRRESPNVDPIRLDELVERVERLQSGRLPDDLDEYVDERALVSSVLLLEWGANPRALPMIRRLSALQEAGSWRRAYRLRGATLVYSDRRDVVSQEARQRHDRPPLESTSHVVRCVRLDNRREHVFDVVEIIGTAYHYGDKGRLFVDGTETDELYDFSRISPDGRGDLLELQEGYSRPQETNERVTLVFDDESSLDGTLEVDVDAERLELVVRASPAPDVSGLFDGSELTTLRRLRALQRYGRGDVPYQFGAYLERRLDD